MKESAEIGAIEFKDIQDLQNGLKDNLRGWITYIESIVYFDDKEND